ncbi:MAG: glycosyltransferase family 2 protein [Roseivirga sp.]|nr:glycosyltransferase family 2 protein [Roseivirga sp.]
MKPLVTIIGIAYNHAPFIREALESLWSQTYDNLQLILLDDGSADESQQVIRNLIAEREDIVFLPHGENKGYTATFNEGLTYAEGEFIIDFALDDVMLPEFIEKSVAALEKAGAGYGVSFTDATYINQQSVETDQHYALLKNKGLISEMPQGDIFEMVLKRYFICTPSMMIRKEVFDRIGGYDEGLAFEDFDFWVRSSRYFRYVYTNEILMKKRKLDTSMSANRYRHWENEQLTSVFRVCEKAFALCKTKTELKALRSRLFYEYRQALRTDHTDLASMHAALFIKAGGTSLPLILYKILSQLGIDFRRT